MLSWTKLSAPNYNWVALASDASGQSLFSVSGYDILNGYNGQVLLSDDFGSVWYTQSTSPLGYWQGIACSTSGQFLVAVMQTGAIYSSPDFGISWSISNSAPPDVWLSVACSSSCQRAVALSQRTIYTSSDFGNTWNSTAAPQDIAWQCVTSDSTGQYLAAAVYLDNIYTSSDYGSTWINTSSPVGFWTSITSDSTGRLLAAVIDGFGMYTSSDYGDTWILSAAPVDRAWKRITSDASGKILAATISYGSIFVSSDFGVTWSDSSAPNVGWSCITSNMAGDRVVAAGSNGLYVGVPSSPPSPSPDLVIITDETLLGLGIALCVFLLAIFVYLVWRRRRKAGTARQVRGGLKEKLIDF